MIKLKGTLKPQDLTKHIEKMFEKSAEKIRLIDKNWDSSKGTPVFTVAGRYTTRGWTEWTQGFQFGSSILQFDATGEETFLDYGKKTTVEYMASHVSHIGVHDHGFNNVSTYGNLLRLMNEGRISENEWERNFYEMSLKVSGAVQAARWTDIGEGQGYVHSFNGPHSLFADTVRSMRALAVAYQLGHCLMGEKDRKISLLERIVRHCETTAKYNVYYGEGRDAYDVRGRVAHESIFNLKDGSYRCPNSQQGYSPFTTWTRGLAWILCGYPELIEFFDTFHASPLEPFGGKAQLMKKLLAAAEAVADYYLVFAASDGICYWDTGAPGLFYLGEYLDKPADPFNDHEPVDSTASAIAAQGLIRLGNYLLGNQPNDERGNRYLQAGLAIAKRLMEEPYLSLDPRHEGLLLHSIYHRPNGWDHIPDGKKIPCGESSMWGDYHLRELGLLIQRMSRGDYYQFFLKKKESGETSFKSSPLPMIGKI